MSPVDMVSTWSGSVPVAEARHPASVRWSAIPATPVAALAQPLVASMARTQPRRP